jgi:hypothetical protein
MDKLTERLSYQVAKIIFSQSCPFSVGEVAGRLKLQGAVVEPKDVKFVLNGFRDNGIVVQQGDKYSLSVMVAK